MATEPETCDARPADPRITGQMLRVIAIRAAPRGVPVSLRQRTLAIRPRRAPPNRAKAQSLAHRKPDPRLSNSDQDVLFHPEALPGVIRYGKMKVAGQQVRGPEGGRLSRFG